MVLASSGSGGRGSQRAGVGAGREGLQAGTVLAEAIADVERGQRGELAESPHAEPEEEIADPLVAEHLHGIGGQELSGCAGWDDGAGRRAAGRDLGGEGAVGDAHPHFGEAGRGEDGGQRRRRLGLSAVIAGDAAGAEDRETGAQQRDPRCVLLDELQHGAEGTLVPLGVVREDLQGREEALGDSAALTDADAVRAGRGAAGDDRVRLHQSRRRVWLLAAQHRAQRPVGEPEDEDAERGVHPASAQ